MDTTSTHYKGKYRNIYAVHEAYPNGGAVGDYVDIGGFAHYWNEDRGTWCVNSNRDSYWDEKFAEIDEGLATETTERKAADTTLQNNITAEATARQAADTTLQNNLSAEASLRQAADTALQTAVGNKADKTAFETLQTLVTNINKTAKAPVAYSTISGLVNTSDAGVYSLPSNGSALIVNVDRAGVAYHILITAVDDPNTDLFNRTELRDARIWVRYFYEEWSNWFLLGSDKVDKVAGKSLIDSDVADAFGEAPGYGYSFDDGMKFNGQVEALDSGNGAHNVGNELKKLMDKTFPLSASATIQPTTLQEKGTTADVTISAIKAMVDGVEQTDETKFYINGIELTTGNSKSFRNVDDTTTYTVKVKIKDGREATVDKKVTFVYPTYAGFGATAESIMTSTNKKLVTSAKGTYAATNATGAAAKYFILVPTGVTAPTSFTMGGAPYVMNKTTQTIGGVSYTVLESGGTYANGGTVNIVAS